jgi:hypothetical protein
VQTGEVDFEEAFAEAKAAAHAAEAAEKAAEEKLRAVLLSEEGLSAEDKEALEQRAQALVKEVKGRAGGGDCKGMGVAGGGGAAAPTDTTLAPPPPPPLTSPAPCSLAHPGPARPRDRRGASRASPG